MTDRIREADKFVEHKGKLPDRMRCRVCGCLLYRHTGRTKRICVVCEEKYTVDTIYLDMDGPLASWTRGVFKLFGINDKTEIDVKSWNGVGSMVDGGLEAVWEAIRKAGEKFWRELPIQPWARKLFSRLNQMNSDIIVLTSPDWTPASYSGKVKWIRKHFPELGSDQLILAQDKHLLSSARCMLIDDKPENIINFEAVGGHGVLFPMPHNNEKIDSKKAHVKQIDKMVCKIEDQIGDAR